MLVVGPAVKLVALVMPHAAPRATDRGDAGHELLVAAGTVHWLRGSGIRHRTGQGLSGEEHRASAGDPDLVAVGESPDPEPKRKTIHDDLPDTVGDGEPRLGLIRPGREQERVGLPSLR